MSWLWSELHEYFEEDDGSLPGIVIQYAGHDAVPRAFEWLIDHATVPNPPKELYTSSGETLPFTSLQAAVALIVSDKAQAIMFMLNGLAVEHVVLPEIGCYVGADWITLDYRMGRGWTAHTVEAFFEVLYRLASFEPGLMLDADMELNIPLEILNRVWRRFCLEHRMNA